MLICNDFICADSLESVPPPTPEAGIKICLDTEGHWDTVKIGEPKAALFTKVREEINKIMKQKAIAPEKDPQATANEEKAKQDEEVAKATTEQKKNQKENEQKIKDAEKKAEEILKEGEKKAEDTKKVVEQQTNKIND